MYTYLVTGTAVLTESIFKSYGAAAYEAATTTQINAAMMIAEQFAIEHINTFLTPTIITGTFDYRQADGGRLSLPHQYVRTVYNVTMIHEASCDCTVTELAGCAHIVNAEAGLIDVRSCGNITSGGGQVCSCGQYGAPLTLRIVYEAGHSAGVVANNPAALLGLTMAAGLALEQIADPGAAEGGPGDPSVSSWGDTGYNESRQFLHMTAFGGSPKANFAARMLEPLRFKRALQL